MKELSLGGALGGVAFVDDDVYGWVSEHSWWQGSGSDRRYVVRNTYVNGKQRRVFLHRLILDAPAGLYVDHINGDPLDNRRENLRLVTPSQNNQNTSRARRHSSTGVRNVTREKSGRYCVMITRQRKTYRLGIFDTLEEASAAALEARRRFMTHAPESASETTAEPLDAAAYRPKCSVCGEPMQKTRTNTAAHFCKKPDCQREHWRHQNRRRYALGLDQAWRAERRAVGAKT